MTLPNFPNKTLELLDTNWDTTNFSPKPTLVNGDDMSLYSGGRARTTDVVEENIVTADSSPSASMAPAGVGYDHNDFRVGVGITIEGHHTDGGGQLADEAEFKTLVDETRRALYEDRKRPFTPALTLFIETEDDLSPTDPGHANYFRYELTAWYEGYEDLP